MRTNLEHRGGGGMNFRTHYTINGSDDYFDLKGNTVDEIRELLAPEMQKRNLDAVANNCWSEAMEVGDEG